MLKGRIKKKRKYLSIMFMPHDKGRIRTLRFYGIYPIIAIIIVFSLLFTYFSLKNQIADLSQEKEILESEITNLCETEQQQRELIAEKSEIIDELKEHKDNVNEAIKQFSIDYDSMIKKYMGTQFALGVTSRATASETQTANFINQTKELYSLLEQIQTISVIEEDELEEIEGISEDIKEYADTIPSFWPTAGKVYDGFGYRLHPIYKDRRLHEGIDIGGVRDQLVYAAARGKVIFSGNKPGFGRVIVIEHIYKDTVNLQTVYAHLNKRGVTVGQFVERGEFIGLVGSSGGSTSPHLHFEIKLPNNTKIDPLLYLDIKEKENEE